MTDSFKEMKVMALQIAMNLCVYLSAYSSLTMLLHKSTPTFEEFVFLVLLGKSLLYFEIESSKLDFQDALEKKNECLYNTLWTLPNVLILQACAYFLTLPS